MLKLIAVTTTALVLAAGQRARAQDVRAEIAGGYSFLQDADAGQSFPAGWFASGAARVRSWLAIAGEVSGNSRSSVDTDGSFSTKTTLRVYAFAGGPRVLHRFDRVTVFGQVLFGETSQSVDISADTGGAPVDVHGADTNFCYEPGGGIDIDLKKNMAVRGGVSARLIRASGATSKEFQLTGGIVYFFRR